MPCTRGVFRCFHGGFFKNTTKNRKEMIPCGCVFQFLSLIAVPQKHRNINPVIIAELAERSDR